MADAGLDVDIDMDAPDADMQLAQIQAQVAASTPESMMEAVGGVITNDRKVELNGKQFRLAQKVGLMPLLKFSAFAGTTTQDPRALGAMYSMLRDVIDPDEWQAFEDHATDSKADADELLDVISKALELIAGRPTEPSEPSSAGRPDISGGSTASSSDRRAKGSNR